MPCPCQICGACTVDAMWDGGGQRINNHKTLLTTYSILLLEGSAGKCGILILHFEKLQKTPDTSQ